MGLSDKIKLYCILHGNSVNVLDNESLKSNNCIKCREKNGGICNIRYGGNRQILFDHKTGQIIKISNSGYLKCEYIDDSFLVKFIVDGDIYNTYKTRRCWFCFGFLNENK